MAAAVVRAAGAASLVVGALAVGLLAGGRGPSPGLHERSQAPAERRGPVETAGLPAGTRRLGKLPAGRQVQLTLVLKQRHLRALRRLIAQHRVITPALYEARYSPRPSLVRTTMRALQGYGLSASWQPGSATMEASGPASEVERAFSVSLARYRAPARAAGGRVSFHAPTGPPTLPEALRPVVSSVLGLDDYSSIAPAGSSDPGGGGQCGASSPAGAGGFTPSQVAGFYDFGPLYRGGLDGSGQTVVFLEVDGYSQSDLDTFARTFGLPAYNLVGPVYNQAWGTSGPLPFPGCPVSETNLDLQVVHAMAPAARLVVYDSGTSGAQLTATLSAAVQAYPKAIFSISVGGCAQPEDAAHAFDAVFRQLASTGGSAFVASGDLGAYDCGPGKPAIDYPGGNPLVTDVGGTTAFLGQGSTYGEEAAWGSPVELAGDGGGLSTVYSRPGWQKGPGVSNSYSDGKRQVPDVSAIADSNTGWDVVGGGGWEVIGGTSAGAPLWAALAALADQTLANRHLPAIGFANPALYDFGSNPARFPAPAFHDVTLGNNLYYPATKGWDFATGWGSPDASALVDDLIAYEKGRR